MKVVKRLFVVSVLACFLLTTTLVFAETAQLTILHTNDQHGHFMKFNPYPVADVGGMAAQSTFVNITRAEAEKAGANVLILSAGDLNTGIPESDMLDAEPDIIAMNMIGYDAMTLGNHEFDKSREILMKQQELAEFPFLSANVVKKDSGEPLVEAYVIKEYNGLKVAIFGLTLERTPTVTMPENTADIVFENVVEVAKELVPTLREEADIVIALTHIGLYSEDSNHYEDGDIYLASQVPGIDVIVGGHTHTKLTEPKVVNGTVIVQAGAYSEYMGKLELTVDTEADKVTESKYELVSINGKKRIKYNDNKYYMYLEPGYVEDRAILEKMKPSMEQASELLSQPVGETLVPLLGDKSESRSQETNLGNLISDGMRAKVGAEIAFQNGGGIRAGIAAGTITYRDILTVQPFGNILTTLDMTGAQVMDVLNYAASLDAGAGAFLHVSGVKWTLNRQTKTADDVMVGDAPIDLEKTYVVVTNNFMASGGDGYAMLKDLPKYETGFVDADAMMEYISALGKVEPKVEGRLTIIE